jgi:hypothetical protein
VPAAVGWTGFGVDAEGTPEARSLQIAAMGRRGHDARPANLVLKV